MLKGVNDSIQNAKEILRKVVEKKINCKFNLIPFFKDLVKFMISGPVLIQVLEGENAVLKNRELMGSTNPKDADLGTIRADFADSIEANAVHGSDSKENATLEISYFFSEMEICPS